MSRGARIWVATSNRGKVAEIREIAATLAGAEGLDWRPASEWGEVAYPPEGTDYRANAVAKARAAAEQIGGWTVADDSGIEVDALDGAPGPLSARYGGPGLDDAGRVAHLLEALADVEDARRGARFVCWAAWCAPADDGGVRGGTAFGECAGTILRAPRGSGGFGYDPVFQLAGRAETMAELSSEEKNRVSHRGRAFALLGEQLFAAGVHGSAGESSPGAERPEEA